jgi:group I intron endonuclease
MKLIFNYPKIFYIYKISNTINDKVYIGMSSNPEYRRRTYISVVKNVPYDDKRVQFVQKAMKDIGIDNFIFEVFEECVSRVEALEREKYWIDYYKSADENFGYNISGGFIMPNNMNYNNFRKKQSKLQSGEHNPMFGKTHTKETKDKISEKISGSNNPFYGKNHSDESKQKIGKASLGRITGENNPHAKLNVDIVINIRIDWSTGKYTKVALSKKYNVSAATIGHIVSRKTWK